MEAAAPYERVIHRYPSEAAAVIESVYTEAWNDGWSMTIRSKCLAGR